MNEQENICFGCGIQLQTTDKNRLGYVPPSSVDRDDVLCQRCFRLKHYNETTEVSLTDDDFFQMVSKISESKGLIVHLVDIFDLNGSIIPGLHRIVGNNPIILVGNKIDLLPKSTNLSKLTHWLRSVTNELGMVIEDVFLISSTKGYGIAELMRELDRYRHKKDVYIVGTTNVGKSTFINRLIQKSVGEKEVITTSYVPGTTLGFIKIPLDDHSYLIDTPGIVNRKQISHYVTVNDLKFILPQKEVKPRVYQLNSEQTLFFGGLARLDFIQGDRQSFVCFFSNEISIHRTKMENADELYERHRGKMLSPPTKASLKTFPPFQKSTFKVSEQAVDIVFAGLGWVTIKGGPVTIRAYAPEQVAISIRNSIY